MKLVDHPLVGNKFTWFNLSGKAMSKLVDSCYPKSLLKSGILLVKWWGIMIFMIIVLFGSKGMLQNWVINLLSSLIVGLTSGVLAFCGESLEFLCFSSTTMFIFKERLQFIKGNLRSWNKEIFGILDLGVDMAIKELNAFDLKLLVMTCWMKMF